MDHEELGSFPFCRGVKCRVPVVPDEEGGCPQCGGNIDYVTGPELRRLGHDPLQPIPVLSRTVSDEES